MENIHDKILHSDDSNTIYDNLIDRIHIASQADKNSQGTLIIKWDVDNNDNDHGCTGK